MTDYEFGDVVLISFPFTDQIGSKQRPAAVISTGAYNRARPDLILIAITSRFRNPPGFGEQPVGEWREAGLLKPSVIKPVIFTAEKGLIRKRLGAFVEEDQERVQSIIRLVIGLGNGSQG